LLLLAFSLSLGCQSDASHSHVWEKWAQRQGGSASPYHQARAQAALNALHHNSENVRVFVLESGNVGAYAWPDGSIFLTSALVEMLEPQELRAVLAHELGHLSDHQISGNASSLLGNATHLDDESQADEFACDLLRRSGFAPHALASALQKVRAAAGLSDQQRQSLLDRVRRIISQSACP